MLNVDMSKPLAEIMKEARNQYMLLPANKYNLPLWSEIEEMLGHNVHFEMMPGKLKGEFGYIFYDVVDMAGQDSIVVGTFAVANSDEPVKYTNLLLVDDEVAEFLTFLIDNYYEPVGISQGSA